MSGIEETRKIGQKVKVSPFQIEKSMCPTAGCRKRNRAGKQCFRLVVDAL
jgi:hypothetical protein